MRSPPLPIRALNTEENILLSFKYTAVKKSPAVGVLLAIFLGWLGAHKFYMEKYVQGAFYAIFCWTFIPAIISFVELFLMPGRVKNWNVKCMTDIRSEIYSLRS